MKLKSLLTIAALCFSFSAASAADSPSTKTTPTTAPLAKLKSEGKSLKTPGTYAMTNYHTLTLGGLTFPVAHQPKDMNQFISGINGSWKIQRVSDSTKNPYHFTLVRDAQPADSLTPFALIHHDHMADLGNATSATITYSEASGITVTYLDSKDSKVSSITCATPAQISEATERSKSTAMHATGTDGQVVVTSK